MPAGLDFAGPAVKTDNVTFFHDLTWQQEGQRASEQALFDRALGLIDRAEDFVVVDMFLFNGWHESSAGVKRPLADELAGHLTAAAGRGVRVYVITDEINGFYGAYGHPLEQRLTDAGIRFVMTPLDRLRDPNPLYSSFYRLFIGPWGVSRNGRIPNPFSPEAPPISLGSILRMANFKGNHRKVLVTENGAMVLSGNAHDASSFHSNIGLLVEDPRIVPPVLQGEAAVWALNDPAGLPPDLRPGGAGTGDGQGLYSVSFLTERAILKAMRQEIVLCGPGDRIDIGVFYLSHRGFIGDLVRASRRGAEIRIILDPNKDAFGREKNGVPNRPVAGELIRRSRGEIQVRWYLTRGEQFHAKYMKVTRGDTAAVFAGSCNFTRRNFENYNLEADFLATGPREAPLFAEADTWFNRIWNNEGGLYTGEAAEYLENDPFKVVQYHVMEATGLCTF
jgi:phosphatidylserine/phosphatidylglycerophosphate/cardiolipin synthase-like enzyme